MKCKVCGSDLWQVLSTRQTADGAIRRRRQCRFCGVRTTTFELDESEFRNPQSKYMKRQIRYVVMAGLKQLMESDNNGR